MPILNEYKLKEKHPLQELAEALWHLFFWAVVTGTFLALTYFSSDTNGGGVPWFIGASVLFVSGYALGRKNHPSFYFKKITGKRYMRGGIQPTGKPSGSPPKGGGTGR